jgi:hypothetical protein
MRHTIEARVRHERHAADGLCTAVDRRKVTRKNRCRREDMANAGVTDALAAGAMRAPPESVPV